MHFGPFRPTHVCTLALFAALLAPKVHAQESTEDRVAALERALTEERAKSEAQAERLKDLELSLAHLRGQQEAAVLAAVDQASLEAEIEKASNLIRESLRHDFAPEPSRFSFRGQGRFVMRAFDGDSISTDQSFEIEHLLLQVTARLEDDLRVILTPGVSHSGSVAMLEAAVEYDVSDALTIVGGRFLVPFNGVHAWAYPSDSFIEPYQVENAPRPFMYTPFWDEGILAKGDLSFGAEGEHRFAYSAYVINGYSAEGLAGFHKRTIGDNNQNKTLGARISGTFRLDDATTLAVGLAGQIGKSDVDDERDFTSAEFDVDFTSGPFSLYGEAFHLAAEYEAGVLESPGATIVEVSRLSGIKLRPQWRLDDTFTLFAQADHLWVRQAPRSGGLLSVFDLEDEETAITTVIAGVKIDLSAWLKLRIEGGAFLRDDDLGADIPFVSLSLHYSF